MGKFPGRRRAEYESLTAVNPSYPGRARISRRGRDWDYVSTFARRDAKGAGYLPFAFHGGGMGIRGTRGDNYLRYDHWD